MVLNIQGWRASSIIRLFVASRHKTKTRRVIAVKSSTHRSLVRGAVSQGRLAGCVRRDIEPEPSRPNSAKNSQLSCSAYCLAGRNEIR